MPGLFCLLGQTLDALSAVLSPIALPCCQLFRPPAEGLVCVVQPNHPATSTTFPTSFNQNISTINTLHRHSLTLVRQLLSSFLLSFTVASPFRL
jgi:hypothetical protein